LIQGGAVSVGDEKISDPNYMVTVDRLPVTLRAGKKNFRRVSVKG